MLYSIVGQHENALQEAEEAARLDPAWGFYSRVAVYIPLEPGQEAKEVLRDAAKRGYDTEEMHWNLYDLAFLEKDDEGMQRELKWAAGKRQQESRLTCWQSSVDAYYGRMAKARELARRAAESANRDGDTESAANCLAMLADTEADFGELQQAIDGLAGFNAQAGPRCADCRRRGAGTRRTDQPCRETRGRDKH